MRAENAGINALVLKAKAQMRGGCREGRGQEVKQKINDAVYAF